MILNYNLPDRANVLPGSWKEGIRQRYQRYYFNTITGMTVLSGLENHDGRWWLHVSCARPDCMPTFEELKEVKTVFVGRDKKAIQVFPSEKEYVNIHPYCLHLFHSDNDSLPDFTHEGGL